MTRSIRLRPWQKRALDAFALKNSRDFLTVATPGAGKTTFALTVALQELSAHPGQRLIVVTPTRHLKMQWTQAAAHFSLHLIPDWTSGNGRLPSDMHGITVTYQQVAANPHALRRAAQRAFIIFDEIHHAGDERAWGEAVREAFKDAPRRLSLSGTPFRSDTNAIPFIHYDGEEARPDFEYGYGDALQEGKVVRPVYFPRVKGHMEWMDANGEFRSHTFDDKLDHARAGQRLRTALSLDGEWLPAVLDRAHAHLLELRQSHTDAAGLVIAMDQAHARGIASLMQQRLHVTPVVATSDDPKASEHIAAFTEGMAPWMVAVRMVSEGVDIPRLRLGVFATNTTTELFFRQAVGRFVRWTGRESRQKAFLFLPDDRRLRSWAEQIREQRRHSLARAPADEEAQQAEETVRPEKEEQLSLFAAISAVTLGEPEIVASTVGHDREQEKADSWQEEKAEEDLSLEISLLGTPPLHADLSHAFSSVAEETGETERTARTETRQERKKRFRNENTSVAREIARRTGRSHAQVNAELNKEAGIRRIAEATLGQLERRLRLAGRWLNRL